MPSLWSINQFANTPSLPGHTRQLEVAAGLVSDGWQVEVFGTNLTDEEYYTSLVSSLTNLGAAPGVAGPAMFASSCRTFHNTPGKSVV